MDAVNFFLNVIRIMHFPFYTLFPYRPYNPDQANNAIGR